MILDFVQKQQNSNFRRIGVIRIFASPRVELEMTAAAQFWRNLPLEALFAHLSLYQWAQSNNYFTEVNALMFMSEAIQTSHIIQNVIKTDELLHYTNLRDL